MASTTALPLLIDIYGAGAIPAAKRGVKTKLALARADLKELYDWFSRTSNEIDLLGATNWEKQLGYKAWLNEYVAKHEERYKKEIARLSWDLDFLNSFDHNGFRAQDAIDTPRGVTEEQIQRARATEIRSLVEVHRALTRCLWHDDRRPSMHIYGDNHGYCFVCNKHADAIDFFMVVRGCTFLEAVRQMAP